MAAEIESVTGVERSDGRDLISLSYLSLWADWCMGVWLYE
jgi:hypothetical protein